MARGWTNSCVSTGATPSIAPPPCTNIVVTKGNGQFSLTWTDPAAQGDNYTWKETVVRYKAGSAPTSATDGTVAVVETTRNQYASTPLTVTGLTNGVTYYISVFPKSTSGGINTDGSQIVSVTPVAQKIYTIRIDQSNSNPLTCCTYADDAVGMTKGSSEWDDIFGYKPCIMQNGVVQDYLNPNDFTKYISGASASITNTNYDVMIEFPRMGLDISTSGKVITIKLTDAKNDSNFQYLAHKRGNVQKDYFYLGAYSATGLGSKLGSNSGVSPRINTSIADFISLAHNRGSGYEIMGFYQWTYVQALYVMKYGNLNSQEALGRGLTSASSAQSTGATNTRGMCYGNPNSGTDRMKLFGLEDLWGNVYQFISGLYSDGNRNLLTTTDNFGVNTSVDAWEYNVSSGTTGNVSGYMAEPQGTNNGGFVIKIDGVSSTTYYSDYAYLYDSNFPSVGGAWDDGDDAGVFNCYVDYASLDSSEYLGSRLMYL
jgi:hypothetical protein|nr:MAG TPA: tail collar fiber protein [Caudoviricetes sp.]